MKKILNELWIAASVFLLASCYSDDSTLGTLDVGEIEIIGGIEDTYSGMLDNNETLVIIPQIKSDYPESDLDYHWYIYQKSLETTAQDADGNYYEPTEICNEKVLNLPINMNSGQYTLILKVSSKTNNYSVQRTTELAVSTRYSQGFYVLKEVNGATELDFFNMNNEKTENVMQRVNGAPIAGKPENLTISYNRSHLDHETHDATYLSLLSVVTDRNEISFLRTTDLKKVLSQKEMFYGDPISGEKPFGEYTGYFSTFYMTSSGVYYTQLGGTGVLSSGTYGNPLEPRGGSKFVVKTNRVYGISYWNENTHGIYSVGTSNAVVAANGSASIPVTNLTNYECIAAGDFFNTAFVYFIFRDKTDNHLKLYTLQANWAGALDAQSVKDLGVDLFTSEKNLYAFNERTAQYAYCIKDNRLIAFNLNYNVDANYQNALIEMPLTGIPSDEEISYVNHAYRALDYAGNMVFDNLVIGTQSSDRYKIYMYNMVGGQPDGAPVRVFSGTGVLKRMIYVHPTYNSGDWTFWSF